MIRVALLVLRSLLRLWPRTVRERYGAEIHDLFAAQLDDARARGRLAVARVAVAGIADAMRRLPYEHWRRRGRPAQSTRSVASQRMESLLLDLRFALRSLRRRPTFAIVSIATLALSIGAATVIYGVVDGVLFRSLPYRDVDRVMMVWQTDTTRKKMPLLAATWDRVPLDYTDFLVWREKQRAFEGVAAWSGFGAMLHGDGAPEQVTGTRASAGLFELLGVAPVLGRTFVRGEDTPGGPHVTVISYETWQTRFGARRDVVGSTIRFDDEPYEIIGVLPEGFTLERGKPGAPFWVPAGQETGDVGKRNRYFRALGKVKAGVTLAQAELETRQLLGGSDPSSAPGVRLTGLVRDETRDVRAPLLILLGAVGLVLLIACVNVATLLLGEAATRDVEMGARIALGASRGRIVRQLLTESLALAFAGGALGIVLAWWGTKAIVALAPATIPGILGVHVDGRVIGVALFAATATGLLFGLAPAVLASETGPAGLFRGGRTVRGRGKLQRAMIATELALSVVLLVGGGLLARSLQKLSVVDPGFRADHLAALRLAWSNPFADSAAVRDFYHDAIANVSALPGVVAATAGTSIPFSGGSSSSPYLLPGEDLEAMRSRKHEVQQRVVLPNYFSTMGIPLVAGRAFDDDDRSGAPLVAIITEAAAQRDFPGVSPIGRQVKYQGQWRTIVGVARDIKYGRLSADAVPSIYTPLAQRRDTPDIIVRTSGDPAAMTAELRRVVQGNERNMAVTKVQLVDDLVHRSFAEERFRTALIGLFAAIAALLAAVGMFGVTARAVSRRTREVGIRVALGATTTSVVTMIVRQTMQAVAVGVAIGTVIAIAASRLLGPYLFGVKTNDPATYAIILALLATTSALASWLPARRAGRVEPAIVLRGE